MAPRAHNRLISEMDPFEALAESEGAGEPQKRPGKVEGQPGKVGDEAQ